MPPTGEEIRLTENVYCAFKFDHRTEEVWRDDNGNYNCVICAPQPQG